MSPHQLTVERTLTFVDGTRLVEPPAVMYGYLSAAAARSSRISRLRTAGACWERDGDTVIVTSDQEHPDPADSHVDVTRLTWQDRPDLTRDDIDAWVRTGQPPADIQISPTTD